MKDIKEFIYIIDSGRLHDHTVESLHAHRNQLGPESPYMTVMIATAGNRLNVTRIILYVLQKKGIHINSAKIVFKNGNSLSHALEILRILYNKCRFPGSKESCNQICFYHRFSCKL